MVAAASAGAEAGLDATLSHQQSVSLNACHAGGTSCTMKCKHTPRLVEKPMQRPRVEPAATAQAHSLSLLNSKAPLGCINSNMRTIV